MLASYCKRVANLVAAVTTEAETTTPVAAKTPGLRASFGGLLYQLLAFCIIPPMVCLVFYMVAVYAVNLFKSVTKDGKFRKKSRGYYND
jgi:hypothetical protein